MRVLERPDHRVGCLIICGLACASAVSVAAGSGNVQPAASPLLIVEGSPADNILLGQETTTPYTVGAYGGSITIDSVALSGLNGASYSIANNTCTGGTVVSASVSCEIDVRFSPQQQGLLTESLTFNTNVGVTTYDVSTNGLAANLLVSPTAIDFGFQAYGTTSATRTLTLKNPNPIPITLPYDYNPILESGANFSYLSTTCETIPANGSCAFQMDFTPYTAGAELGQWYLIVGAFDGNEYPTTQITLTGTGVEDGATNVDLSHAFNTVGISNDNVPVQAGGIDGAGNAYSYDFLQGQAIWAGQTFGLGVGGNNAVHQSVLSLPTGQYYGVTVLATGVNGNQVNQSFTVTYTDGTSTLLHQSFSDWKTPQHYLGESIAVTNAYRLTAAGARHTGPYYLYAYTLPLDRTKTVVSLTLPNNRNVVALAANVEVAGVPVTAELDGLYDVTAVGEDGQPVGTGIDGHGSAISYTELNSVPFNELLLPIPQPNLPDAIAEVTVPLPSGQYSSLQLDGLAVEGNLANQMLTINYQDGTSAVVSQGFSDWHTFQKYSRESIAVAMTYRLNSDGSKHAGAYNVYQYDIPIDSTKLIRSVILPKTPHVVILSVALKP